MTLKLGKKGFVGAGHGLAAVEEVAMTSDDKRKTTSYYYYYWAYDPGDATDVRTSSAAGIDEPGLESGRVTSRPCSQVVEVEGHPKRTSDTTDRPWDYYSRMEHLAETT